MYVKRIVTVSSLVLALGLPAGALGDPIHVVEPGESLTSIAAADGLSVANLAAANGLSPTDELECGQVIEIPPQTVSFEGPAATGTEPVYVSATPSTSAATTSASAGGYTVQPGDSLSGLAARLGTSVAEIAALNGLSSQSLLYIGQHLTLPGGAGSAATGPGNQQETGETSGGPYPTDQWVSSGQVGDQASSAGVDPSLAEAIGWQESGFNNDEVSPTGAVGVMQIEPATWSFINQVLTPGDPLSPYSATANVAGGVLLLHDLVAQTGSDSGAAAAYYQGLESVREHGLYPSTEQYVADVNALRARFGG